MRPQQWPGSRTGCLPLSSHPTSCLSMVLRAYTWSLTRAEFLVICCCLGMGGERRVKILQKWAGGGRSRLAVANVWRPCLSLTAC